MLSLVIPAFNEEESLPHLLSAIQDLMANENLAYEIIFVDDGSNDGSEDILRRLHNENPDIRVIFCRRNYGKANALNLGFKAAEGDYVITMDADLQDNPKEIPRMIAKLEEGYDLVSGWKRVRHDPWHKTMPSKLFNWVVSKFGGIKLHDFNCGFKIYRRDVVKSVDLYGEMHRFVPILAHWQGFRVAEIPVEHQARQFGHSKYGIERFLRGLFDFLTVFFITKFKTKPLHFFGMNGVFLGAIGFAILSYLSVRWFFGDPILNRPLFTLGVLLLNLGVLFFLFGLLAEMMIHLSRNKEVDPWLIKEELPRSSGTKAKPSNPQKGNKKKDEEESQA